MARPNGSGGFPWLMAALSLLLLVGLCLLALGILHRPAPGFHPPGAQYKALASAYRL